MLFRYRKIKRNPPYFTPQPSARHGAAEPVWAHVENVMKISFQTSLMLLTCPLTDAAHMNAGIYQRNWSFDRRSKRWVLLQQSLFLWPAMHTLHVLTVRSLEYRRIELMRDNQQWHDGTSKSNATSNDFRRTMFRARSRLDYGEQGATPVKRSSSKIHVRTPSRSGRVRAADGTPTRTKRLLIMYNPLFDI